MPSSRQNITKSLFCISVVFYLDPYLDQKKSILFHLINECSLKCVHYTRVQETNAVSPSASHGLQAFFCFDSKDQCLVTSSINLIRFRRKKINVSNERCYRCLNPLHFSVSFLHPCSLLVFTLCFIDISKIIHMLQLQNNIRFAFVTWIESSLGKMQSASHCKLNVSFVFFFKQFCVSSIFLS